MIIKSLADFKIVENVLRQQWLELQEIPNVFRYKLVVQKQKILDGKFRFVAQVRISDKLKTFDEYTTKTQFFSSFFP